MTGQRVREYRIEVYEAEEGGFWCEVAGLPGCVAQGETLEELREAAIDAIRAWDETRRELGGDPAPRPFLTMDIPVDDRGLVPA